MEGNWMLQIMAADPNQSFSRSGQNSGQSLVEFVLILPVVVGMLFLLVQVNSAIQVSIVNQKYSRQRIFELAANSPNYPSLGRVSLLISKRDNRMVIGVSEESTLDLESDFSPSAPTQMITRTRRAAEGASNEAGTTPMKRANVRIRNTVEICTPILFADTRGAGARPISDGLVDQTMTPPLNFCSGGLD